MDIIDQANHQAELALELQLKARKPTLQPIGCCHNCNETLPEGQLFCDASCAQDWEHRSNREAQCRRAK